MIWQHGWATKTPKLWPQEEAFKDGKREARTAGPNVSTEPSIMQQFSPPNELICFALKSLTPSTSLLLKNLINGTVSQSFSAQSKASEKKLIKTLVFAPCLLAFAIETH